MDTSGTCATTNGKHTSVDPETSNGADDSTHLKNSSHLNGGSSETVKAEPSGRLTVPAIRVNRIESSENGDESQHSAQNHTAKSKVSTKLRIKLNLGKKKRNVVEESESEVDGDDEEKANDVSMNATDDHTVNIAPETAVTTKQEADTNLVPENEKPKKNDLNGHHHIVKSDDHEMSEAPKFEERRLRNSQSKSRVNPAGDTALTSPTVAAVTVSSRRSGALTANNRSKIEAPGNSEDVHASPAPSSATSPSISDTSKSSRHNRSAKRETPQVLKSAFIMKETVTSPPGKLAAVEAKNTRRSSLSNGKAGAAAATNGAIKSKSSATNGNSNKKKTAAVNGTANKRTRITSQVSAGSTEESTDSEDEVESDPVSEDEDEQPASPVAPPPPKKTATKKSVKH
jgi:hypothetical protein